MDELTTETPQEISKKELLLETGISYGQLYRWKREGLIPEDWFEKRSSYTGQETFFPRKLVLDRVEVIQSMKDGLSLSEIRDMLNAVPKQSDLKQTLLETGSMSESFIDELTAELEGNWLSELSLKAVLTLYSALDKAQIDTEIKIGLISQVIELLCVKVPVLSDGPEINQQSDEASASDEAETSDEASALDEAETTEQATADEAATAEATTTEEKG